MLDSLRIIDMLVLWIYSFMDIFVLWIYSYYGYMRSMGILVYGYIRIMDIFLWLLSIMGFFVWICSCFHLVGRKAAPVRFRSRPVQFYLVP